ncbi:MAG: hypothetical protein HOV68_10380 [Streptomycetaceae bacterium]|nr:hypothetical protein [Streptomycetaceae bacterium]
MTAVWDKKITVKDGRIDATVTFTVTNKGSVKMPGTQLQVTPKDGVAYKGDLPKGCKALNGGTITCDFGELKDGGKKTLKVSVTLSGTKQRIDGVVVGGSAEAQLTNNAVSLDRVSTPSPSPKPSKSPAKSPSKGASPSGSGKPDPKPKCGPAVIEYSKDGGKTWTRSGLLGGFVPKLKVRLVGTVKKGCEYKVSYASYSAEGPTWKKSGTQGFLGMDTVTLTSKKTSAELDIAKHLPPCYGQVDLYGNGKKFDGKKNPLPHYPNAKFPTNLIAGWNGGKACAPKPPTKTPTASTTPSKSESASPSVSPSKSESPSTTPSATETPTATTTPTETPTTTVPPTSSESPIVTPPPSPSTSQAPPAADTSQQPPVADQQVVAEEQQQPSAEGAPGSLAKTGASDRLPYLIAMAVCSILLGALALFWFRGRNAPAGADAGPGFGGNPWARPSRWRK